ncbi:PREDICTED: cholesterol 24-hydroxylase-like [Nanorana parkeri]|uniref:cholesterol 24-hydroxylase-like n=1 Tax=Nanorana parkeri TaxID=125878 RepID=UPI000854E306|nr:PREDICTED: cholesterol 24-hydroxylase-like [Nanorana parkeri]
MQVSDLLAMYPEDGRLQMTCIRRSSNDYTSTARCTFEMGCAGRLLRCPGALNPAGYPQSLASGAGTEAEDSGVGGAGTPGARHSQGGACFRVTLNEPGAGSAHPCLRPRTGLAGRVRRAGAPPPTFQKAASREEDGSWGLGKTSVAGNATTSDIMDFRYLISSTFLLIVAIIGVCFLLYCGYIYYIHRKYDHIPGPPRDSFLFGHTPSILKLLENNGLVHDLFLDWAQTYGPVVRINILHDVKILLSSPESVKAILMSSKYKKDAEYNRACYLFGERFMGNGLVTDQDNQRWEKQRRIIEPAFSKHYLMGLMGPFNEKAEELVDRLAEKADGKCQVEMHDVLSRVTLDGLAKAAFGLELKSLEDEYSPFPQAISLAMKGLTESMNPLAKYIPWKQTLIGEIQRSVRLLRDTGKECIKNRQKAQNQQEETPEDVLAQMLRTADLENDGGLESLVDNVVTLIIGGQETTANLLSFAVMELAQKPEILKKAQAEADEVIGLKTDITYEDLEKLEYLSQVLKETLRLYSPAPGTSRLVEEEIVLHGVKIPPDVTVMFNSYVMGRMERFFQDPLVFNPDRFHPDAAEPYFSYFPFSLGPRACVGKVFAQIKMKVILAKLVLKFNFHLVEGQTCKLTGTGMLQPLDGVFCKLRLRTRQRRSLTRRTM